LLLSLTAAQGLTQGSGNLMLRAIVADVSDAWRSKSGEDRTGLLFSVFNVTFSVGAALAVGATLPLVAWFGFRPGTIKVSFDVDFQTEESEKSIGHNDAFEARLITMGVTDGGVPTAELGKITAPVLILGGKNSPGKGVFGIFSKAIASAAAELYRSIHPYVLRVMSFARPECRLVKLPFSFKIEERGNVVFVISEKEGHPADDPLISLGTK